MKSISIAVIFFAFAILSINNIKLTQNDNTVLLNKNLAKTKESVLRKKNETETSTSNDTSNKNNTSDKPEVKNFESNYVSNSNQEKLGNLNQTINITIANTSTTHNNKSYVIIPYTNSNASSNQINNNENKTNTLNNTDISLNKPEDKFEKVVYVKQISVAGKQALELEESGE